MNQARSKPIFRGLSAMQGLALAAILITILAAGAQAQISQYYFTYYYSDGSGDYYTGSVFAPTDFQTYGPLLAVGKALYNQPEPMGGQALGGYYQITSITNGYSTSYDKQQYITSYYDNDKAKSSFAVSDNDYLSTSNNYVYVGNRTLADELGYVIRASDLLASSFSPFFEADLTTTYRFVVMGDSRSDTAINTTIFNTIIGQITNNVNPDFVMFLGDMSRYGGTTQLEAWETLADALRADGIEVYVAKGNHELDSDSGDSAREMQSQYQDVFHYLPDNGPDDYENLTYVFRYGNSAFVALDSFYATAGGATYNEEVSGVQLDWLNDLNLSSRTFRFAFSHDAAYTVTGRTDDAELWDALVALNFDVYFGAHEHLYSRWTIDGLPQIITGTVGAPFVYTVDTAEPEITVTGVYNFVVVDVNGSSMTLTTYGYNTTTGAFYILDTVSY
jgi:hypothetical protein